MTPLIQRSTTFTHVTRIFLFPRVNPVFFFERCTLHLSLHRTSAAGHRGSASSLISIRLIVFTSCQFNRNKASVPRRVPDDEWPLHFSADVTLKLPQSACQQLRVVHTCLNENNLVFAIIWKLSTVLFNVTTSRLWPEHTRHFLVHDVMVKKMSLNSSLSSQSLLFNIVINNAQQCWN